MRGGPRSFIRGSTSPVLLWYTSQRLFIRTSTGLSPALAALSRVVRLGLIQLKVPATPGRIPVWAVPISLAATYGIDVSFYSCRYLDVSVPCVRSLRLYIHRRVTRRWGFPIRRSRGHRLFASSPERFVGYHVLHRLSMPRHPPYTLSNLITLIDHPRPGQDDSCLTRTRRSVTHARTRIRANRSLFSG